MLHLIQLVTLLITFLVSQEVGAQECDAQWFGEKCMYRCNCDNGVLCDNSGNCPGKKCSNSYFGPGCQFYDRVEASSVPSTESFIKDHNSGTCNPNKATTSIQVTLKKAYLFMWFRIEFQKRNSMSFVVLLNNGTPCYNDRKFPGSQFVDVTCDNRKASDYLKIIGPIAPNVCSIYISGGRNVALKQSTIQSSTYQYGQPEKAVDGDMGAVVYSTSCSHTLKQDNPWWGIMYNHPQFLLAIFVHNRMDIPHRLQGFNLQAFSENGSKILQYQGDLNIPYLCYELVGTIKSPTSKLKITGYNHADTDDRILTLCEVETFGETVCPEGTYGLWCQEKCQCRGTRICNPITGVCARGCSTGFYGFNCSLPCSNTCLLGLCTNRLGKCLLCIPGKTGDYCENESGCTEGKYGLNCSETCKCYGTDICNPVSGNCTPGCNKGFYGFDCSLPCRNSCLDGLCTHILGKCLVCRLGKMGDYCENDCQTGFHGAKCLSRCSPDCVGGICNVSSGKCFHCNLGYTGDHCLDACERGFYGRNCSLACGIVCNQGLCTHQEGKCLHCYPGHEGDYCEKICRDGFFGNNCESKCSKRCKDICEPVTGNCACVEGFAGATCLECMAGKYGEECKTECPSLCSGQGCNITTGECFSCDDSHSGTFCEDCATGKYGGNCTEKCSIFCSVKGCNRTTGKCLPCKENDTDILCKECVAGKHGKECTKECPRSCSGQRCNRTNGQCLLCDENHSGNFCQDCSTGKYGKNCTEKCSIMCIIQGCNRTTGKCLPCSEENSGLACKGTLEDSEETIFEHWWIIILLISSLSLSTLGITLLCLQVKDDEFNEENWESEFDSVDGA